MEEFTVEEIIEYHIEIIQESDREEDQGLGGKLLIPGNLDFVVEISKGYADPFEKAAFILHGLATGHAFILRGEGAERENPGTTGAVIKAAPLRA